ncbi:phage gp6-like head-tail connector protein, partial [Mycobacterium tuberculosis]|nr:phage gp6-like head-tail connector protein [Mycobacterium tuberculosis]
DEYTTQMMREVNEEAKYELTMQLRGIVVNDALETGILLILGDLYANRENTTDKAANELPMGAKFHLQPFRRMLGV